MLDEILHALSDPTRREILKALRAGDRSAGELARRFDLARSTLSGHFNVLKRAGLILSERQGTTILYSLNTSVAEETLGALVRLFSSTGRARKDARRRKKGS